MGTSCSYEAGNQADPETDIIEKRLKNSESQADIILESPVVKEDVEDVPRQSLSDLKISLDSRMAQNIDDVWCYFCQQSYKSELDFMFCPKCGDKLITEKAYMSRKEMNLSDKLKILQYESNNSDMTPYNTTLEGTQAQSILSHHETFQKKANEENLSREDSMNLMADMLLFSKDRLISPRMAQNSSMFSPGIYTPSRTSNMKSPQIYPMNANSPSISIVVDPVPLLVSNDSISLMRNRYKELVGKLKEAGEQNIPRPKSKGLMEDILLFNEELIHPNVDAPFPVHFGTDSEDEDRQIKSENAAFHCENGGGSLDLHQRNSTVNISESVHAN